MRTVANVGKSNLKNLIEIEINRSSILTKELSDIKSVSEEFIGQKYIPSSNRDTKYQILLFMLLHFYSNGDGVIVNLQKSILKDALGCSHRTLNNSLQKLNERERIEICYEKHGVVNAIIKGFKEAVSKDGGGYIILTQAFMYQFIKLDGVNELRLGIKAMLIHDATSLKGNPAILNRDVLKYIIPTMNYPKAILEILKKFGDAFKFNWNKNIQTLSVWITKDYIGKLYKKNISTKLGEKLKSKVPKLPDKDFNDFISLALEYGIEKVVKCIDLLKIDFMMNHKNLGGHVRSMIQTDFQFIV